MNKKALTTLVVILVLIVGVYGVYRVYNHFKRLSAPAGMQTATSSGSAQPATTLSSLKDLIAKGLSQTCSYSTDKSQGSIYMSGGKVRADIDTTVGSVAEKAHMIMINGTSYIWMDGKTTGFKMTVDLNATPVPGASPSSSAQSGIDPNTAMNYKCSVWLADASKFTLPTDVKFATFSIPTVPGTTNGSSSSLCSNCDSLSGDAKTQCLTALKCN